MKHMAFLFIMLCLLMTPSAMAWESAVHAKGVQDICKAFGFSEAAAIRVGDGAWYDGNDIRLDRKEGEKGVSAFRNQDRVFNTGVLAEGTPVKTYGKFSISPNDTRYLSSRKYLNKAISLMKEENPGEALYDLGVGVRAFRTTGSVRVLPYKRSRRSKRRRALFLFRRIARSVVFGQDRNRRKRGRRRPPE